MAVLDPLMTWLEPMTLTRDLYQKVVDDLLKTCMPTVCFLREL